MHRVKHVGQPPYGLLPSARRDPVSQPVYKRLDSEAERESKHFFACSERLVPWAGMVRVRLAVAIEKEGVNQPKYVRLARIVLASN